MSIPTRTLALGHTPVNLIADPEIASKVPVGLALQNISAGRLIFYAARPTSPAPASREGMLLRYGDREYLEIEAGDSLWVWTTSATAVLAITGA